MNDRKQQIVSVDPNHVRKSLSKCFLGHPPQGQHSLRIIVHQQNTLIFINIDMDSSFDTSIFFSPSEIKDPPLRIKTYGKTCKILAGMQYHITAMGVPMKKECQCMTMGVYTRTLVANMNHVFHSQGTPWLEHILMSSMLSGWWFSTWLNGP